MISTRTYRKALPVSDAIAEIRRCSGTQLDPDIVLAFPACQLKIVMPGDMSLPKEFEESFLALFRPRID
jgi:HD-GYP domain-containing protein (c-di-GMP phosphodiesterase class II)